MASLASNETLIAEVQAMIEKNIKTCPSSYVAKCGGEWNRVGWIIHDGTTYENIENFVGNILFKVLTNVTREYGNFKIKIVPGEEGMRNLWIKFRSKDRRSRRV